jgi:hypothetical protein
MVAAHVRIASYRQRQVSGQQETMNVSSSPIICLRSASGLWNKRSRLHAAVQTEQEQILRDDFYIQ